MVMSEEEKLMIEQAKAQINLANADTTGKYLQASQQAGMIENEERSMAQDQLDLSEEKIEIEHLLRGHIIKEREDGTSFWSKPTKKTLCKCFEDENGIRYWVKTLDNYVHPRTGIVTKKEIIFNIEMPGEEPIDVEDAEGEDLFKQITSLQTIKLVSYRVVDILDTSMQPLNEFGVRIIMKVVSFYLSKRKLLSNYSEEMINEKMEDFSTELADLIFMKYREMGLDTPDKRKMYSIIVREIQDAVHDVYLRALCGKERDSLRRHLNINENIGGMPNQPGGRGWNPMQWLRR